MTYNTLTALKTPYASSLHNRCTYLPDGDTTCIPSRPGTEQYAPAYPVAHNPLRYKRQEDFQTNISHSYKTATSIAYTQSWDEYHRGLFSYYLYDHFGRPVETGQAKITHIRTGDHDKAWRMTDAEIWEHIYSLSNRLNVMVAIYNDVHPFPACSPQPQDHRNDKINTIYYYPCIHAATPRGADGQYYPEGSWYAADYHYTTNDSITITGYQCTAREQELPITVENTAEYPHLIIAASTFPGAIDPETCGATLAPHSYNCPLKNLDFDTLQHLHSQVFYVLYGRHQSSPPGSEAAGTALSESAILFYYSPYYSISPGNSNSNNNLSSAYNTRLTGTHHCRGHTVAPKSLHHYCHSPPS